MKKSALLLFLLVAGIKLRAQDIQFIDQDWNKAVALSKEQHKPLFVDFFTDWCGWCKQMDKTTYKDKAVVDFINNHFIPVKINAEKDYGITLAMKYRMNGYPSFAYVTMDGKLASKSVGYMETEPFLKTIKQKAEDIKKGEYYKGVSDKVDLDYPDFYKDAYAGNGKRRFPSEKTVSVFLKNQPSLTTELAFCILYSFDTDSSVNQYFLENLKTYRDLYGEDDVNNKVYKIIYDKFTTAVTNNDPKMLDRVLSMIDKYIDDNKEDTKTGFRIAFYQQTRDWKNFSTLVDEGIAKKKIDDNQLNEYSWDIYEKVDDEFAISKALDWMSKVVLHSPDYAYLDTYASLLYKASKYDDAEKYAEKAIETGRKNNENVSSTENLLTNIKAAKAQKP